MGEGRYRGKLLAEAEGHDTGTRCGYAAGVVGAEPDWVNNELDVFTSVTGDTAKQAHADKFNEALWDGYNTASQLPPEVKQEYQTEILRFAADERVYFGNVQDPNLQYKEIIRGIAVAAGREGAPERPTSIVEDQSGVEHRIPGTVER